jgi:hypothetical protein
MQLVIIGKFEIFDFGERRRDKPGAYVFGKASTLQAKWLGKGTTSVVPSEDPKHLL